MRRLNTGRFGWRLGEGGRVAGLFDQEEEEDVLGTMSWLLDGSRESAVWYGILLGFGGRTERRKRQREGRSFGI